MTTSLTFWDLYKYISVADRDTFGYHYPDNSLPTRFYISGLRDRVDIEVPGCIDIRIKFDLDMDEAYVGHIIEVATGSVEVHNRTDIVDLDASLNESAKLNDNEAIMRAIVNVLQSSANMDATELHRKRIDYLAAKIDILLQNFDRMREYYEHRDDSELTLDGDTEDEMEIARNEILKFLDKLSTGEFGEWVAANCPEAISDCEEARKLVSAAVTKANSILASLPDLQ